MIKLLPQRRRSPIGVDIGSKSIKLVQLSADHSRVVAAVRLDVPPQEDPTSQQAADDLADMLSRARQGRGFRGQDAVLCLSDPDLFVQNVRVPKGDDADVHRLIYQEAVGRVPFDMQEAELRFIDAADVRQGEAVMREMIILACQRPVLDRSLDVIERAGLRPVAVDIEPAALLRNHIRQQRRDEDRDQRKMLVNIGYSRTAVVIAHRSDEILFVKYLELGGQHFDEAVAEHLEMSLEEAASLRRHNGDRRRDQQDPEVARSLAEAMRPVVEQLSNELSMCLRYHSVTFRGNQLQRLVLSGGEATTELCQTLDDRFNLKCELSDPWRGLHVPASTGRAGNWDVSVGLALWEVN